MVKEGKADKTVAFSKTDGTAISFKARVTRSKQPTNNYVRHTAPGALDVEQLEVTVWYEVWRNMTTRTTTDGRRTWTATR